MVFWCFQGVEKGCIGNEWVKILQNSFLFQNCNTRQCLKWVKNTRHQQSISCIGHTHKNFIRKYRFIFSFFIKLCEHVVKFIDSTFSSKISRCQCIKKIHATKKKQLSACQCPAQSIENLWSTLYNQIAPYFEKIFSKIQTCFRKGFNPQNSLVAMIEKFRNLRSRLWIRCVT